MSTTQTRTDSRRLLAAVDAGATGFTPQVWDRVCEIAQFLDDGPLDTNAIAAKIRLSRHATRSYLNMGRYKGVFSRKDQSISQGPRRIRSVPSVWSLNIRGIRTLAKSRAGKPENPCDGLTKQQCRYLDSIDPITLKLSGRRWLHMARLIALIGSSLTITREALAGKLGYNRAGVHRILRAARNLGFIEANRNLGHWPGQPNELRVNWDRIRAAGDQTGKKVGRITVATLKDWRGVSPVSPANRRLGKVHRQLLASVEWRATGAATLHRWLRIRAMIAAIGSTSRRIGQAELGLELGMSEAAVHTYSKLARRLGLIRVERKYDALPGEGQCEWTVQWAKLEALAGERRTAATSGAAKAAGKRSKNQRTRRDTKQRNMLCQWVLDFQQKNDASRAVAYQAFQREHPGTPDRSSDAIDQLFRRFRRAK